jgi:hypothetical protein
MKYTEKEIEALEVKAKKWDDLGEQIGSIYCRADGTLIEEGDEDYDEEGLLPIGEMAASAYGWI